VVLIVGPRLDRPTAVGDEGRPRAASLAAATLAVALYVGTLVHVLGLWGPVRLVALGVGLTVVGVSLLDREDPVVLLAGHFCLLPGGVIVLAGIAVGTLAGPAAALLALGLVVALFGLGGAWADSVGRGRLTTALEGGALATVFAIGLAVVAPLAAGAAALVWVRFGDGVVLSGPSGFAGVLFLVTTAALAAWLAVERLPFVELAPPERRPDLERQRSTARRVAMSLVAVGFVGWLVVGILEMVDTIPDPETVLGPVLATVLVGTPLRVVLALATVVAFLAVGVAGLARRVAGLDADSARRLAPLAGAFGLLSFPLPLLVWLMVGLTSGSPGILLLVLIAFGALLAAAVLFLTILGVVVAAAGAGLLPDRAAPLALVAAGLFGIALGAGIGGAPAPVVFAGVGAAAFVWDVSEFGLGLTAELGHLPDTRRVELFHGVASVGVGLAGVALAGGLRALVDAVEPGTDALVPAMVLAFAGTVALLAAVEG